MRMFAALIAASWFAFAAGAQRPAAVSTADLVELDVVALDRNGQSVTDLRQDELTITEDGHPVETKTFAKVTALGSLQPDDARVVVLLMDDIGVPITGTSPMQQIAPVVIAPMGQGDELSVVRLSSRSDEAFGDLRTARERIAGYRGGVVPFSRRDTPETMLRAVTKISNQLEAVDRKRKVLLCLGLVAVCDVEEPPQAGTNPIWGAWVSAISAAARANVSVYVVDPTGARGGRNRLGNSLVDLTGGRVFAENNFAPASEAIWREAGHYYLIGYWPPASNSELHSIDVRVARKGVQIHARQRR